MNIPQPQTYKGYTIRHLGDFSMACPWFIDGLRRHCRNVAHAQEIIDAREAAGPVTVGGLRVVAADVRVENMLSASARRNRSEQATGRKRVNGRFA